MVVCALLTQGRSSAGSFLVTGMMYMFYWAYRRFRQRERNFIGSLIVWSYPLMGLAVLAASVLIGRIRRRVWGGGEHLSSNLARVTQYHTGIPMVLKHPWGYGMGRGGQTLGFFEPSGLLTIDTYYLMVALEYGVIGFLVFYSMFVWTIYKGGRAVLSKDGDGRDRAFLAPAVICLTNFVIIAAVFSQQDNNPIVYMVLGMVVALLSRDEVGDAALSTKVAVANRRRLSNGFRRRATFGGARGLNG
jgi:O-antigen ligase